MQSAEFHAMNRLNGLASLGAGEALYVPDAEANRQPILYVANMTTAVGAALNAEQDFLPVDVENDKRFICTRVVPRFRLAAAVGGSLAGTPLPQGDASSITIGSNTFPTLHLVDLQISVAQRKLFTDWVPADMIGDRFDAFKRDVFWVFEPSARIKVRARNRCFETGLAPTLFGTLLFEGYHLSKK